MRKQDSTENKANPANRIVRVVRVELVVNEANALQYLPSAFLSEIMAVIREVEQLEIHLKIKRDKH